MRVKFSPEARLEFDAAEGYDDLQLAGLGQRFRAEVRSAVRRIRQWPLSCPTERGEVRRLVLSRFPDKLPYPVETDHLCVIAVAHPYRRPGYWVDRIDPP